METEELQSILQGYIHDGLLINIGGASKSSYKIIENDNTPVGEILSPIHANSSTPQVCNPTTPKDQGVVNSDVDVFESLDSSFYKILCDRIQTEVKKQVNLKMSSFNLLSNTKVCQCICVSKKKNDDNELIEFLKDQLVVKDSTIEKLINKIPCNNTNDTRPISVKNTSSINDEVIDSSEFTPVTKRKQSDKRVVTIIGDSVIKDLKAHKMNTKVSQGDKLFVKSFPGATIEDMNDYAIPTKRRNPDLIIIHAGTNDLRGNTAIKVASDLMKLALDLKTDNNDIMVSGLTSRADALNTKTKQVNINLKTECDKQIIFY